MNRLKRFLCVLLAVIILFNAPGYVPKAQAVAAVDDAAVITLGLLMATLAGVTFSQCDNAVSVMQNFLSTKTGAASTIMGLTSKALISGTKLFLTRDVRDVFETVLPEIKSFFQTESDNVVSSGGGSLVDSVVVGSSFPVTSFSSWSDHRVPFSFNLESFIGCIFMATDPSLGTQYLRVDSDAVRVIHLSNGEWVDGGVLFDLRDGGALFKFEFFRPKALFFFSVHFNHYNEVSYDFFNARKCTSPQISLVSATASIPYYTSKEVDGSQAQNALATTDLPDTVYGDDRDHSIDIGAVSDVIVAGLAGSTAAPGLSPDAITKAIQDAVIALPLPTTPPASEPTTATEPTDEPLVPMDPVTPGFLGDKFSDLNTTLETIKQGFLDVLNSILSVIQTISDGLTRGFAAVTTWLDAFWDTFKQVISDFWSDVVTAVTVTIPTFLGDIADAAVEFFTVTFPAWVADVKAWAVALPATITQAIVAALTAVFVPAAGYWDAKVAACTAAFPLFNSIIATGHGLSGFLSGLGTRPPVIYIDLGSSTSWFLGGRQIFLDLTWYSQYKPTMDLVISGFLWLLFAWRFFLRLPGLLRGEGGTIDRLNTYFDNKGDNR